MFYFFHNCSKLKLGATGPSYQKCGVRLMVAEFRPRLRTNGMFAFTTVVVSFFVVKYRLLRLRLHNFISASKIMFLMVICLL